MYVNGFLCIWMPWVPDLKREVRELSYRKKLKIILILSSWKAKGYSLLIYSKDLAIDCYCWRRDLTWHVSWARSICDGRWGLLVSRWCLLVSLWHLLVALWHLLVALLFWITWGVWWRSWHLLILPSKKIIVQKISINLCLFHIYSNCHAINIRCTAQRTLKQSNQQACHDTSSLKSCQIHQLWI